MSQRTVGIVVAMGAEARALTGTALPLRTAIPISDDVLLWIGGVGGEPAAQGCKALIEAGAGALASFGTAAGLAPDSTPGTLVLPRQVVPATRAPIAVDDAWHSALRSAIERNVPICDGALANAESVLGPAEKQALHRRSGAVSADMESAAIAEVSSRLGLPLMVVRAVSDGPADAVPAGVLEAVDAFGRPDCGRLLASLAKRPSEIKTTLRLAAGFRTACRTLRLVVRCSGPRLRCPD